MALELFVVSARTNKRHHHHPFIIKRRVPSPNRYMAFARFCFCKNNKRTIIIIFKCFIAVDGGIFRVVITF